MTRIFGIGLPIVGGMVSQNILNLVDTAMVGTLGNAALAAVGLGGFATFMCQAMVLGLAVGVQTIASRRKGEGNIAFMASSLNAGLLIALIVGPLWSIIINQAVPHFYPYLNSDPAVIAEGVPYLQWRVLAMVFVGMNFCFRGYWNAVDLSRLYMKTLLVMHACNIFLNYTLIFGNFGAPALGVEGAAIGTSASTAIGTVIYFYLGIKHARGNAFLRGLPRFAVFKDLIRLSIPNGIQQSFFAAGFTTLYWIIGQVGTVELAAANVLINISLICILPAIAMGLAATTLVGQALGRKEPSDAKRWGWDVTKVTMSLLAVLGLPMWIMPDLLLGIFIHDPITLEVARLPMRIVGLTIAMEGAGLVLMNALLGAGDAKRVMFVSILSQWTLFLPLAYLIGPVWGLGLTAIWGMQASYRLFQAIVFAFMWKHGNWATIKV